MREEERERERDSCVSHASVRVWPCIAHTAEKNKLQVTSVTFGG